MSATLGERPTTRDWLDDGDDCLANAISTSLQLQNERRGSQIVMIENAYLALHPDWNNAASTIVMADFWRALFHVNIWTLALHDQGDLVDQVSAALALGRVPVLWVYLDDERTGKTFHHAVNCYEYVDGTLYCWDAQIGIVRELSLETFGSSTASGRSSGYGYVHTWIGG